MSFLFCFNILELHNIFVATPDQKRIFYNPFHKMIGIWLFGLWIHVQKLPERCFPDSRFVHKFLSSDILKSIIVIGAIFIIQFLLRDTMKLAENHRAGAAPVPVVAPPPHIHPAMATASAPA